MRKIVTALATLLLVAGGALAQTFVNTVGSDDGVAIAGYDVVAFFTQKKAVGGSPSCRASRYGRRTSPGRAGSRKLAMNPITVVRNAVENRVGPIDASRYCQRAARRA